MEKLTAGADRLGLKLTSKQVAQFELYYSKMSKWNQTRQPDGDHRYEGVQIKHFLDSLTVTIAAFRIPGEKSTRKSNRCRHGGGDAGNSAKIIMFPSIRLYAGRIDCQENGIPRQYFTNQFRP